MKAIESRYIQNKIQNAAFAYQRGVESGERIVVGVNRFRMEQEAAIPTFRLDPAIEQAQIARLREVRASRDQARVAETLQHLEAAARGSENLLPSILDAAASYATVGEIADTLRTVFGEYREAA